MGRGEEDEGMMKGEISLTLRLRHQHTQASECCTTTGHEEEDMDCPMKGEVFAHVTKSKALDWLSISPCHVLWLADTQVNKCH